MFNLNAHLSKFYNKFPEGKHQPVIGITTNYSDGGATLSEKYYNQVVKAGGTPYLIPPVADQDVIINTLEHLDGLLLTGGGDFNPLWCGEEPSAKLHRTLNVIYLSCSSPVWHTTDRYLCSVSAAEYRPLP